jgi:hypothetical protein
MSCTRVPRASESNIWHVGPHHFACPIALTTTRPTAPSRISFSQSLFLTPTTFRTFLIVHLWPTSSGIWTSRGTPWAMPCLPSASMRTLGTLRSTQKSALRMREKPAAAKSNPAMRCAHLGALPFDRDGHRIRAPIRHLHRQRHAVPRRNPGRNRHVNLIFPRIARRDA